MTVLNVALKESQVERLQLLADRAGVSAEEFLNRRVAEILDDQELSFEEAAKYVLKKNAELYRRLA